MLRFIEVNNPRRSKYEGLAKEFESACVNMAATHAKSESKLHAEEDATVKAESERLKVEDALKNKKL